MCTGTLPAEALNSGTSIPSGERKADSHLSPKPKRLISAASGTAPRAGKPFVAPWILLCLAGREKGQDYRRSRDTALLAATLTSPAPNAPH